MNEIEPRLADLDIEEFLNDTPAAAQRAWIRAYGLELVREALPECWAAWESDEARQIMKGKAVYIRNWLSNKKKERTTEKPQVTLPRGSYNAVEREGEIARMSREEAERAPKPSLAAVRKLVQSVVKKTEPDGG